MFKYILAVLLLPSLLLADSTKLILKTNELFDQANELALKDPDKSKKLYKSVILKYQNLIETGVENSELYTNLGNAYFFFGDKGRALLNYHRAYRLAPSNSDISHNIEFLKTQTVDIPPNSSSKVFKYVFIWHLLSFQTRLFLFILLNSILWSTFGYQLYRKNDKLKWALTSLAILTLLLLFSLLTTSLQWDNSVDGIVTEREVTPRQGNGYIYEMALSGPLHSGCEFKLLETRKNWYHIELSGGTKCWIPKSSSTLVEE